MRFYSIYGYFGPIITNNNTPISKALSRQNYNHITQVLISIVGIFYRTKDNSVAPLESSSNKFSAELFPCTHWTVHSNVPGADLFHSLIKYSELDSTLYWIDSSIPIWTLWPTELSIPTELILLSKSLCLYMVFCGPPWVQPTSLLQEIAKFRN